MITREDIEQAEEGQVLARGEDWIDRKFHPWYAVKEGYGWWIIEQDGEMNPALAPAIHRELIKRITDCTDEALELYR